MVWKDPGTLRAGDIFAEMRRLALASAIWVGAYIGVLGALAVATDYSESYNGMTMGLTVAQTGLQYMLVKQLMTSGGLLPEGTTQGFWSFFGLGILSGIAIIFGLLLLVIPGVILLVRWLPAYGFVFGENLGVSQSLERSWQVTKPHFAALLVAALPSIAVYACGMGALASTELLYESVPFLIAEIVGNLLIYAGSAIWTVAGIAAYSVLAGGSEGIGEVFA